MRTIQCWHCGAIVQATGEIGLCPQCHVELKSKSPLAPRICRICGATFQGGPRAWYCPSCREEQKKKTDRDAKARAKAGKTRKIGSTDVCVICGAEYVVNSGRQRYCPKCAPEAIREEARKESRAWIAEHREAHYQRKAERAQNRRVCKVCGKPYYSATPTVTCSPRCGRILRSYNQAMADHRRRGSQAPTMETVAQRLDQKSGIPGVSRSRNGKRWVASYHGKYLGTYDTVAEAAAVVAACKEQET